MTVKTAEQATLDAALGMARSGEHADAVEPDWRERAVAEVADYCSWHGLFLTEDVRDWAERHGFPKPPDGRAWGSVMREAQRRGLIEPCGWLPARSSNHSPKRAWRAK